MMSCLKVVCSNLICRPILISINKNPRLHRRRRTVDDRLNAHWALLPGHLESQAMPGKNNNKSKMNAGQKVAHDPFQ